MKPIYSYLFSLLAALSFHAALLFGYHIRNVARPIPVNGEAAAVAVNLIDSAPGSESSAAVAPEALPEPAGTPEPAAMAAATPEPAAEQISPTETEPESSPASKPTPENIAGQAPQPALKAQPVAQSKPKAALPAPRETRPVASGPARNIASAPGSAGNHGSGGTPLPCYRSNPKPDYPPIALQTRHEGVVLVAVDVSTNGRPTSVNLAHSSGFAELDQSALHTMWRWRFEPARLGGLAVASHVNIPVRFRINS